MPAPSSEKVLQALDAVIALGKSAGAPHVVEELERHRTLFLDRKPTLKQLHGPVKDAADRAFHALRAALLDVGLRDPLPGKEALVEEFYRAFGDLNRVIYPPRFVAKELDATGWAGSSEVEDTNIRYMGAAENVQEIFERSVDLVMRYRDLVCADDLEAAYALTAPELQHWMRPGRFVSDHRHAEEEFGGPPLEFRIGGFGWIFPDAEARGNAEVGRIAWPRWIPKEVRRAIIYGFWLRDRARNSGDPGSLWITEDSTGSYRIARFEFSRE